MLLDYSTCLYYASFQELKSPNQSFAVIITHIFPSAGLCSVMRSRLHCLELWLLNKSESESALLPGMFTHTRNLFP